MSFTRSEAGSVCISLWIAVTLTKKWIAHNHARVKQPGPPGVFSHPRPKYYSIILATHYK
jgi:hypothetical protein